MNLNSGFQLINDGQATISRAITAQNTNTFAITNNGRMTLTGPLNLDNSNASIVNNNHLTINGTVTLQNGTKTLTNTAFGDTLIINGALNMPSNGNNTSVNLCG